MALYHYTTKSRHDEIISSGKFKSSSDTQTDSTYGIGWYFTDLGPDICDIVLMDYCWQKDTFHQRVKCFFQLEVVGGQAHYMRNHVYFVPQDIYVSFNIVRHGEVPECSLKPCYSCEKNPNR